MRIAKSQQNTVVLTLNEKATTANPQWLFKLTNDQTGFSKIFAAEDVSDYQERYNLFRITESSSEDLTDGIVSLTAGRWSYVIYEMEESSPRNLDPEDALSEVETGICIVTGPDEQINNFTEDEEKDNGVFDEE